MLNVNYSKLINEVILFADECDFSDVRNRHMVIGQIKLLQAALQTLPLVGHTFDQAIDACNYATTAVLANDYEDVFACLTNLDTLTK